MTDLAPLTVQEIQELRRRLDRISPPVSPPVSTLPADPPLPAEGSWAHSVMVAQEERRKRWTAAVEAQNALRRAQEEARDRKIADLKAEISDLEARRAPIADAFDVTVEKLVAPHRERYRAAVEPIDARIHERSAKIKELERTPLLVPEPWEALAQVEAAAEDDGRTGLKDRIFGKVRKAKVTP